VNFIDPFGLHKIKICLNSKKLKLTDDDGKELLNADVIKGCKDTSTPTGKFKLGDWQKDKTSKRWGDDSSTPWSKSWWGGNVFGPYFVPVLGTNGVGIHGHRGPRLPGSFTAASLVSPCSHGCVRLSNYDIETMHDLLPKSAGTQVEIIANCE
jgi:lipoprotein-anchoring transpeptidase ErfK/SrfK